MTDIEALVVEWRDARQAFFNAFTHGAPEPTIQSTKILFNRLANAEVALMARARTIWP